MSSSPQHLTVRGHEIVKTPWGWRDVDTGRWAEGPRRLYRYSYGVTFAVHGEYSGAVIEAWSLDRQLLSRERQVIIDRLQTAVADHVGYDWGSEIGNELWPVRADGEGTQEVPYEAGLEDSWEWWIEDDEGRKLKHDSGGLS